MHQIFAEKRKTVRELREEAYGKKKDNKNENLNDSYYHYDAYDDDDADCILLND